MGPDNGGRTQGCLCATMVWVQGDNVGIDSAVVLGFLSGHEISVLTQERDGVEATFAVLRKRNMIHLQETK